MQSNVTLNRELSLTWKPVLFSGFSSDFAGGDGGILQDQYLQSAWKDNSNILVTKRYLLCP